MCPKKIRNVIFSLFFPRMLILASMFISWQERFWPDPLGFSLFDVPAKSVQDPLCYLVCVTRGVNFHLWLRNAGSCSAMTSMGSVTKFPRCAGCAKAIHHQYHHVIKQKLWREPIVDPKNQKITSIRICLFVLTATGVNCVCGQTVMVLLDSIGVPFMGEEELWPSSTKSPKGVVYWRV